jgi:lipoprotein LprG
MTCLLARRAGAALLPATHLLAAACSGDSSDAVPPEQRLAAAKTVLDATSGVHLVLATPRLPQGVTGLLRAEGDGTHDPAFEGTIKVLAGGITADAEVVAVDGTVHAKLPFTTKFVPVDPGDYGAPDPAVLMSADRGLSSLLAAAQDVVAGKQRRDGKRVLDSYQATVPGEAVAAVIPSAATDADFDASFTVDDQDQLAEAVLTGPFYGDADEVTYTITFSDYGSSPTITAP